MKSAFTKSLEEKLTNLVVPIAEQVGCELVELQLVQRKSSALLRILIDKVGGVTLDDCSKVSRELADLLEVENPIESRYTLEVSSPGLDRPLTTADDFRRKVGESVKVAFKVEEKTSEIEGEILKVEDNRLTLSTKSGEKSLPLNQIVKGRIIF